MRNRVRLSFFPRVVFVSSCFFNVVHQTFVASRADMGWHSFGEESGEESGIPVGLDSATAVFCRSHGYLSIEFCVLGKQGGPKICFDSKLSMFL
jgi:hypothetical protein